jgi:hypothetical protein
MSKPHPHLNLANVESAAPIDEEVAQTSSTETVEVQFVFPNNKKFTQKFAVGDTALAMKRKIFDIFEIDYDQLQLSFAGVNLIGARGVLN